MQYRKLPKTGEEISSLGFGCMRLPTHVGGEASNLIHKERARKQITMAIEKGVNYLDTAYPYHLGASETFLGEHILNTHLREKVKIATKLPCMTINKKKSIEEIFNKQLKKLQVDYIDFYLLHALNGKTWDRMVSLGIVDFMDDIKEKGLIRNMGFSFHGSYEDFVRIIDSYPWDFTQVQYNILDINFQAGIKGIEYAYSKDIGVIVMEPLRGGSLVGKLPVEVERLYREAPTQRSAADWALRWILNHPAVMTVLSGMNEEDHIIENINVANDTLPNGLSDQELDLLDRVRQTYKSLMKVPCTGCAYCMPCPANINIPSAFKQLNNYHMFSKVGAKLAHAAYAGIQTKDGQPHWTMSCIDCGQCEKACPQDIQVRKEFKHVQKSLEGPGIKVLAAMGRKVMSKR